MSNDLEKNEIPEGATKVGQYGFVKLVDHYGGDARIVEAARTSYGKGTKTKNEDRGLIRYLLRPDPPHSSPFEMTDFTFLVQCPMSVWRQWIRHRTASVNEYSTRYSEALDMCDFVPPNLWRAQSKTNKQGSGDYLPFEVGEKLSAIQEDVQTQMTWAYTKKLEHGAAREQARDDLPLGTYTRAYWKINMWNLFHFLALRMDHHAQLEIRQFANAIADIIKPIVPISWQAFEDFRLNSVRFSAQEIKQMRVLFGQLPIDKVKDDHKVLTDREWTEFVAKLQKMDMMIEEDL